jgi:hypothetical protein
VLIVSEIFSPKNLFLLKSMNAKSGTAVQAV